MRVLVAPDSFKGTLTAGEVATAVANGLAAAGADAEPCPVADGGEGTMTVLADALAAEGRSATVSDPLGRPVTARWALVRPGATPGSELIAGTTAIVETAQASGLGLVAPDERDAEAASTTGAGQLIAAAIDVGAARVLVTVGGSATTDGGAGAVQAITAAGGLRGARLVVLCDVTTPFERAAAVFGPQKGADPATVRRLERRLDTIAGSLPRDPRGVPMTGAAGGLSGGLWAAFGADLVPGAPAVLDAIGFGARLAAADAVVLGEGQLDEQSLDGKVPGEIARRAAAVGVPVHAIVGSDRLGPRAAELGLASVAEAGTLERLAAAGHALGERLAAGARR